MKQLLDKIQDWLFFIETYPLVSGYEWSKDAKEKWAQKLIKKGISAIFDIRGNILLGSVSESNWYQSVLSNPNQFILQAHWDHPGGTILSKLLELNSRTRYSAVITGALIKDLKGRHMTVVDTLGQVFDNVLITQQINQAEKCVSFTTEKTLPADCYLLPPGKNDAPHREGNCYTGWGLDDHLGCAIVLTCLETCPDTYKYGLLTANEEVGGAGLCYVMKQLEAKTESSRQWPVLLNLEVTPEYRELGHIMGQGAHWRLEDSQDKMDQSLLNAITASSSEHALALKEGRCEAGMWAKRGGRALCIALPCYYYHNAKMLDEWRIEEVDHNDVASALNKLRSLATFDFSQSIVHISAPTKNSQIIIHDHTESLRHIAESSNTYLSCLRDLLPGWNKLHLQYNLPTIKFSIEFFEKIREKILKTAAIAKAVSARISDCSEQVLGWLGQTVHNVENLKVHYFIMANFNASQTSDGIKLSLDNIDMVDINRILIHEMTHFYLNSWLKTLNLRPVYYNLLNEGIACLATIEILGIPESQALGLSLKQYADFTGQFQQVSAMLLEHTHAKCWNIVNNRHEVIEPKKMVPPFKLTHHHQGYLKYGYYLGLLFVKNISQKTNNFPEWIMSTSTSDICKLILDFLQPAHTQKICA